MLFSVLDKVPFSLQQAEVQIKIWDTNKKKPNLTKSKEIIVISKSQLLICNTHRHSSFMFNDSYIVKFSPSSSVKFLPKYFRGPLVSDTPQKILNTAT
jgi:hypothetical protein